MTRQFSFSRRRVRSQSAAAAQVACTSPVDASQDLDATVIARKVFHTLPIPALLLDRRGTVQFANAEASTILGPSAIGHHLGRCFVADRADASLVSRGTTIARSAAAPVATYLSGWLKLADSHWVAAQLRFERAAGLRHGGSPADVIALVHLQQQATLEMVPVGSIVN